MRVEKGQTIVDHIRVRKIFEQQLRTEENSSSKVIRPSVGIFNCRIYFSPIIIIARFTRKVHRIFIKQ